MNFVSYEDPGYVEHLMELCVASIAPQPLRPRPGSLWLSRSTGRRAVVLWASEALVCLSYDETHVNARKVHRLVDFERLYIEAR